jgi:hypothetical protein
MAELASWARAANFARIRPSRPREELTRRPGHLAGLDFASVFPHGKRLQNAPDYSPINSCPA